MNTCTPPYRRIGRTPVAALLVTFALLAGGCLGTRSYVDPGLPAVSYADLQRAPAPRPLVVDFQFQTNGSPNQAATQYMIKRTRDVLKHTRLFTLVDPSTAGAHDADHLHVTMNNVADIGDAVVRGFGTGLTFGVVGSQVTDGYEFNASYQPARDQLIQRSYKHAIYSTVGNHKGPEGLEPMSVQNAVNRVHEQLLLTFLRDVQQAGQLGVSANAD